MEPIINPIWFYVIFVFNSINFFASLLFLVGCVATIVIGLIVLFGIDESEKPLLRIVLKKILIGLVVSVLISTFVPDKTTIEKMIVAKNITPNNIELFGDTVKDGVDYVFEKINSLEKEE